MKIKNYFKVYVGILLSFHFHSYSHYYLTLKLKQLMPYMQSNIKIRITKFVSIQEDINKK